MYAYELDSYSPGMNANFLLKLNNVSTSYRRVLTSIYNILGGFVSKCDFLLTSYTSPTKKTVS